MSDLAYTLSLSNRGFLGPMDSAIGRVNAMAGKAGRLAGTLAKVSAAAGGALGIAGIFKGFKGAAEMEQTRVAFETLIGDMDLAGDTIERLRELGKETPFEFPELADAGRKLVAFGEAAGDVDKTLRMVGDVASGTQTAIGELAEIYGKARVQGTLFSEDINQLTGRGIPIIGEMAEILGVAESEIKGMAAEGKITFPLLEQAFRKMTGEGGKFHGMMQRQSKTTLGLWSTLKDNIGELLRTLGEPINDAVRPLLEDAVGLAGNVADAMTRGIAVAKQAAANGDLGAMVSASLEIGFKDAVNYGVGAMKFLGQATVANFKTAFSFAGKLFSGSMNLALGDLGSGLLNVIKGLGNKILAELGKPFQVVVSAFQAGLELAIETVKEGIAKIPILRDHLEIPEDHTAESFQTYFDQWMQTNDPTRLANLGDRQLESGIDKTGAAFDALADELADSITDSWGGVSFEKADVLDTDDARARLEELYKKNAGLVDEINRERGARGRATTETERAAAATGALADVMERAAGKGKGAPGAGDGAAGGMKDPLLAPGKAKVEIGGAGFEEFIRELAGDALKNADEAAAEAERRVRPQRERRERGAAADTTAQKRVASIEAAVVRLEKIWANLAVA